MDKGFITCLWFDGRAEEAAEYYTSIFPGSSIGKTTRYTEAGPGEPGSVITVEFDLNGQKFVGLNGGPEFTFNESISFQIFCDGQEEVDRYWDELTSGGGDAPQRTRYRERAGCATSTRTHSPARHEQGRSWDRYR
jgi:predicted 3-demethylubiquinone-9 3-methyltransferase (glyoxalase superfamily)